MENPPRYQGLPIALNPGVTDTKHFFAALDNFTRTFAFRTGEIGRAHV